MRMRKIARAHAWRKALPEGESVKLATKFQETPNNKEVAKIKLFLVFFRKSRARAWRKALPEGESVKLATKFQETPNNKEVAKKKLFLVFFTKSRARVEKSVTRGLMEHPPRPLPVTVPSY
jgi:hypothetical protein